MKRFLLILVILGVLGGGGYAAARGLGFVGPSTEDVAEGVEVRRGPMRISVLESGNLAAADSVELKSELEGSSTILYLIPEGTFVEPGDLLVELDTTDLRERRLTQEIAVQSAESQKTKAEQILEIQRSQNASDVAAAERQLEFAKTDKVKYMEGDWPQQQKAAEDEILLAQEELARAEEVHRWSSELEADGFLTSTELEADRLSMQRAEINVAQTERAQALLSEYDHPREILRLTADVEEAERELDRVRLQATARLVDFEADLQAGIAKLSLEREKLEKYEAQIEKARMFAPIGGMVVYARQGGGRWSRDEPISEGKSVRERERLITIPSANSMLVEASVHESVLEQVQVGQDVLVEVDAIPERSFLGRVKSRAVLPDQNTSWMNPDLRVYETEIEILELDPSMRPGMSCSVEVLVEELEDALHVPVQSIFVDKGEPVAFVAKPGEVELRKVEVGQRNEAWVQILSGLKENEVVLLSQPDGFQLEPAREQSATPSDAPGEFGGDRQAASRGRGTGPGSGAGPNGAPRQGAGKPTTGGAPSTSDARPSATPKSTSSNTSAAVSGTWGSPRPATGEGEEATSVRRGGMPADPSPAPASTSTAPQGN